MVPLIGMALVLGALGLLFALVRIASLQFHFHPEIARKALHVGMGAICTCLPLVFHEAWPVVVLGAVAGISLLALRLVPALHASLGQVLHAVKRTSLGEFYFIIGVTALFALAHEHLVLYVVPMLWLTFADATAAVVGVRYGTVRYTTHDGRKSMEGSVSFAVVTFMTTFVALVAFGNADAFRDGMISSIAAILAMLLEAVTWDGFDNLAIPVFGSVILQRLIVSEVPVLSLHLAALLVVGGLVFWHRRQTTLSDDALLASILSGYALFDLGGWLWLLAPATVFLKDKLHAARFGDERRHDVHAVMATCSVGLCVGVLNFALPGFDWYYVYSLGFAVSLALFDLTLRSRRTKTPAAAILQSAAVAALLIMVPFAVLSGAQPIVLEQSLAAVVIVSVCCGIFYWLQPEMRDCPRNVPRWARHAIVSGLGAAAGCLLAFAL